MLDLKLYEGREQTYIKHFVLRKTRHPEGLRTFRDDAERPARPTQKQVRYAALQRRETERSGQMGLFAEPAGQSHSDKLESRYQEMAWESLLTLLRRERWVSFDRLQIEALRFPLTSTSDLKAWLKAQKSRGSIRYEGLGSRERVPKRGKNHFVVYLDDS